MCVPMRLFFRSTSLLLAGLCLSGAATAAEPARLRPVDKCASEAGFAEFRTQLKQAVAAKDERRLLAMLSNDVTVNFGGGRGSEAFAHFWKFGGVDVSPVWKELEQALSRGCARDGDALISPSFLALLPDRFDPYETAIILPGSRLRAGKAPNSAAKGPRLNWHLAEVVDDIGEEWLQVRVPGGPQGFVSRSQTANPLDYRLLFKNRDGKWLITAFVAGD